MSCFAAVDDADHPDRAVVYLDRTHRTAARAWIARQRARDERARQRARDERGEFCSTIPKVMVVAQKP
jgi:hypothetical protein